MKMKKKYYVEKHWRRKYFLWLWLYDCEWLRDEWKNEDACVCFHVILFFFNLGNSSTYVYKSHISMYKECQCTYLYYPPPFLFPVSFLIICHHHEDIFINSIFLWWADDVMLRPYTYMNNDNEKYSSMGTAWNVIRCEIWLAAGGMKRGEIYRKKTEWRKLKIHHNHE